MSLQDRSIEVVQSWYAGLKRFGDGLPARGSIAAALIVLERLKSDFQLDINRHRAAHGQTQIEGHTISTVERILLEFGESRPFSGEGGRTNRGAPGDVAKLLESMRPLDLESATDANRVATLVGMQKHIVTVCVAEYFRKQRLKIVFDSSLSTSAAVRQILDKAREAGVAGPVAQYFIGAKLALRFLTLTIANERYSSPDAQTGRLGDFEIGTTAFHVTVTPSPGVFEKCKRNLDGGSRVYLLVPESQVVGARQLAEVASPARIAVESIESFVSTNIDELSMFDGRQYKGGFRRLIDKYNERVNDVELDKSMMIEIPRNLE